MKQLFTLRVNLEFKFLIYQIVTALTAGFVSLEKVRKLKAIRKPGFGTIVCKEIF